MDPDAARMRDLRQKEKEAENFNETQERFIFFTKSKKERKEDKDSIYLNEKLGQSLLPDP